MTDFTQLQLDFCFALLADDWLSGVNIITRERLYADQSRLPDKSLAAEVLAYITPRNGKIGAGIIVEMPEFQVLDPSAPGPQGDIILTVLILEERGTNLSPTKGTGRYADQIAQKVLEIGHGWNLNFQSDFVADRNAIVPAKDFEPLHAYRVNIRLTLSRDQTTRVTTPTITWAGNTVTLANNGATPNAAIWYTLDGSSPAPANPAATLYHGPFNINQNCVLRYAAFQPGWLPSGFALQNCTIT
jgi:hypothetical protein